MGRNDANKGHEDQQKSKVFYEQVRISGFLWKKKDGFMKRSWQRRFVMIKGSFLVYFTDTYGEKLKAIQQSHTEMTGGMAEADWLVGDEKLALGTIPISQVWVSEYKHKTRPLTFSIGHPDRRSVFFSAESEFQLRNWMTHIQRAAMGPVNPPASISLHYERLGVTKEDSGAKIRKV